LLAAADLVEYEIQKLTEAEWDRMQEDRDEV